MKIETITKKILSDTVTPVGLYLKLRDKFHNSFLLESSDYHGNENNFSFICLEPIASFVVQNETILIKKEGFEVKQEITNRKDVISKLQKFIAQFEIQNESSVSNGIFGYTAYDSVKYFETLDLDASKKKNTIPEMNYSLFRFIIQIDHFKNELTILENKTEGAN